MLHQVTTTSVNVVVSSCFTLKYSFILGDDGSYYFWEDNGWPNHPGNKGLTEPRYTTSMALHTAQPEAKLIVLLRDPTERYPFYEHLLSYGYRHLLII
jgi:hypothetical protein